MPRWFWRRGSFLSGDRSVRRQLAVRATVYPSLEVTVKKFWCFGSGIAQKAGLPSWQTRRRVRHWVRSHASPSPGWRQWPRPTHALDPCFSRPGTQGSATTLRLCHDCRWANPIRHFHGSTKRAKVAREERSTGAEGEAQAGEDVAGSQGGSGWRTTAAKKSLGGEECGARFWRGRGMMEKVDRGEKVRKKDSSREEGRFTRNDDRILSAWNLRT